MENFVFRNPVKIIFGVGEIKKAGEEAAGIGKKALIVTGQSHVKKSGLLEKVGKNLEDSGVEYVHFEGIEPNPRSTTIDKAGKIARENNCDMVLGLGGGSTMDASKAIAVVTKSGYPIWDYVYNEDPDKKREVEDALPIMLIPTVAATASEGNRGAVISSWETKQKAGLFSDFMYPKVSIVDPELTVSLERQTTIDGAMDIMSHVIESYLTGPNNTPLQDRFSEGIMRTVMENLEVLLEDPRNLDARANMSWCSTMALLGPVNLGRPGPFPLHFIEHVISGHYDIAHGRGLAIMLPPLMRYTFRNRPGKYAQLARNIFFIDIDEMELNEAAEAFISRFEDWMKQVGMYARLSDEGIGEEKLEKMVDDTIEVYGGGENYIRSYKPLYKDDLSEIFQMAL
ncbi:MAG: iron-containing alcohol dehydrogenase [candidate division Zixibacteria bacterium]|nr:iron-containing alcohol dehydrogenase [candidate division Zixibacteria bacterium]NIR65317.1 iron-containing alcohol dehydrogenase [candidate division Zixibacteria bacterium]NIS14973.1 iron-containing alcohol dehydrogenase [candidate division Zixibacteria bacterium]NIS45111.1 iron-containing alcohol dehydrogenase [candidate division Zixibacteria bacterium]NIT51499.1 iron-containing alcohol dehydrogenase [candidate division Zixibacteria bacterium]